MKAKYEIDLLEHKLIFYRVALCFTIIILFGIIFAQGTFMSAKIQETKSIAVQICEQNNRMTDLTNRCVNMLGITNQVSHLNCEELLK